MTLETIALDHLTLQELRTYRPALSAEEDRVSYLRSIVQARLDVLHTPGAGPARPPRPASSADHRPGANAAAPLYGRVKHGLAGALHTVTRAKLASEGYGPVVAAIALLLQTAQQAGTVRRDVDTEEVLLLVGFLWRIDLDADWQERPQHMLELVMDSLRNPTTGELLTSAV